MPAFDGSTTGDAQGMRFRSRKQLEDWVKIPKKKCMLYRFVDEYRERGAYLRFAFCGQESPYLEWMERYVEVGDMEVFLGRV